MKKIIALILAGLMLLSFVACGGTKDETDSSDVTTDAPTTEEIVEPAKPAKEVFDETLGKFYEAIAPLFEMTAEEVKGTGIFAGGYFSDSEVPTMIEGASGTMALDVEDAVNMLKANALVTDDVIAKIDDAAMFAHGMNGPTLTVSFVHVADSANVEAVASAMREAIGGNEIWMCGFPENYIVITLGDYVLSGYGKTDMIASVKTAFTTTYADAVVVCDEVIE